MAPAGGETVQTSRGDEDPPLATLDGPLDAVLVPELEPHAALVRLWPQAVVQLGMPIKEDIVGCVLVDLHAAMAAAGNAVRRGRGRGRLARALVRGRVGRLLLLLIVLLLL
jgi:hypothetical protein